jgi:hypothetical protein
MNVTKAGFKRDKGKLLIIDVDNINFVDNPEDLETFSIESMQSCMGCFNPLPRSFGTLKERE